MAERTTLSTIHLVAVVGELGTARRRRRRRRTRRGEKKRACDKIWGWIQITSINSVLIINFTVSWGRRRGTFSLSESVRKTNSLLRRLFSISYLCIHQYIYLIYLLSIYIYQPTYQFVSIFSRDAVLVVYSHLNTGPGDAKKPSIITRRLSAPP